MRALEEAKSDYERKLIQNIQKRGYQVTSVLADESSPAFACSIGIFHSYLKPELLVVGLGVKECADLVDLYARRVSGGEKPYEAGNFYPDFLTSFDVYMLEANEFAKNEKMLSCKWFYKGFEFPALQCVWPSVKGFWPWDAHAWDDYKKKQPLYGVPKNLRN